jgi:hypothetical protein
VPLRRCAMPSSLRGASNAYASHSWKRFPTRRVACSCLGACGSRAMGARLRRVRKGVTPRTETRSGCSWPQCLTVALATGYQSTAISRPRSHCLDSRVPFLLPERSGVEGDARRMNFSVTLHPRTVHRDALSFDAPLLCCSMSCCSMFCRSIARWLDALVREAVVRAGSFLRTGFLVRGHRRSGAMKRKDAWRSAERRYFETPLTRHDTRWLQSRQAHIPLPSF